MLRMLRGLTQANRLPEVLHCRAVTRDWLRLTAAYLGFPVRLPFSIRLASGTFQFREISDVATFWAVFFREDYPVSPYDHIIADAGANIGCFTLYALLRAPVCHVIAIEPAPDSFQRLQSLLLEHGLAHRCTLHQAALAEASGVTSMSLIPQSQFRSTGKGEITVPAMTLEQALAPYQKIDLLKIDTEGAEYPVFASASPELMQKIERIVMEYHPTGDPQVVFDQLHDFGFSLIEHQDNRLGYGTVHLVRSPPGERRASTRAVTV